LRAANESGDIFSKAHANTFHGLSCYCKGYLEEAKEHLLKGVEFAERINQIMIASIAHDSLAETYFALGEYKKSQRNWKRAISLLQKNQLYPSLINLYKLALARAKTKKQKNIDLESLYGFALGVNINILKSSAQRQISEILLTIDNKQISEAEDCIKKAIAADKRKGLMFYLAKDYVLYSELLKQKEDLPKAKENLNKAIEIFKECEADEWAEKKEKKLAALSKKNCIP
jgi:tetratricopeptide (TPR) repeat protein